MNPLDAAPGSRLAHVLLSLACGVAVLGFVHGTRRPARDERAVREPAARALTPGVRPAPSYGELRAAQYRADPARHATAFAAMEADRPELLATVERDPQALAAARERRAAGRAYAGAPPTIPHPIDQRGYPDCRHCHERGLRVDDRHAAMLSHEPYESCTQCHTTSDPAPPPAGAAPRADLASSLASSFEGRQERTGERAYPGAPPTMPHASFMRERCESCHGVLGVGIRTTHPWRSSCPQCHAPSAALEQRPPLR